MLAKGKDQEQFLDTYMVFLGHRILESIRKIGLDLDAGPLAAAMVQHLL
jgi:hypothetical protein